jgi:NTP pyrophosphatase (non-canonical NTP hydrolase)
MADHAHRAYEAALSARKLYESAIEAWGQDAQLRLLQEECGELVASISRLNRGRCDSQRVAEEIADVIIMCEQARLIVGPLAVDAHLADKLHRLGKRLAEVTP